MPIVALLISAPGCKKGGRECIYPESASSKAAGSSSSKGGKAVVTEADLSSDEYEEAYAEHPRVGPDEDRTPENDQQDTSTYWKADAKAFSSGQTTSTRRSPETPPLVQNTASSPTPSTEGSIGYSAHQSLAITQLKKAKALSSSTPDNLRSDWSHLPPDLQLYLTHFCENVTYLHYSLKFDPGDFLRTTFLDAALRNEELLYGLVGFSAFQLALHTTEGKLEDFLPYYNKSVSLLLKSLKRGDNPDFGTLLAILQLATIEVRPWM